LGQRNPLVRPRRNHSITATPVRFVGGKMKPLRTVKVGGAVGGRTIYPDKHRVIRRARHLTWDKHRVSRMRIATRISFFFAAILAGIIIYSTGFAWWEYAKFVDNHDGDTFTCRAFGGIIAVRVAEIDAPETSDHRGRWPEQPWSEEARAAAAAWLAGEPLRVIPTGVSGRRLVAQIRIRGGRDLARALVRAGLAWVDPRYCQDQRLFALQAEAQAARRGLWSDPQPVPPWEWRRGGWRRIGRGEP